MDIELRTALTGIRQMTLGRRRFMSGLACTVGALATPASAVPSVAAPRARFLLVNDLAGDVDGLFAAAHALISPSLRTTGIVATSTGQKMESAAAALTLAKLLLTKVPSAKNIPIYLGSEGKIQVAGTPIRSDGAQAIVDEAKRDDPLPLYIGCGGGLTEIASALMIDPSIAERFTLVWIGGESYPAGGREYNFDIDPFAARFVFNESTVPIWQVPRNAYARCMVSLAEIEAEVAPQGLLGAWLYAQILATIQRNARYGLNTGSTWTLGDNPLVLLTGLTAWFPRMVGQQRRFEGTDSSKYTEALAPEIVADGKYVAKSSNRNIRVYDEIDNRLILEDFYARLKLKKIAEGS
ncbi:hypothetical protein ASE90_16805 [Sphingomonas sp. Leaf67]|uniref:nucleoside hydrolase n=1 Tax=Sphingomonas sp. Leaf67 TaxID=1736230 RepID=UPI0006FD3D82|nr:nucleoside hydrolase [Sphingomonas sp. Leaf67]KQN90755.1 hypothetical protein ASE90_16805 [Sphingomonas sp. Leaf67]